MNYYFWLFQIYAYMCTQDKEKAYNFFLTEDIQSVSLSIEKSMLDFILRFIKLCIFSFKEILSKKRCMFHIFDSFFTQWFHLLFVTEFFHDLWEQSYDEVSNGNKELGKHFVSFEMNKTFEQDKSVNKFCWRQTLLESILPRWKVGPFVSN